MKKFLTFFALLCALLGFSSGISAAEYTLYVDVSAKGWNDVYCKVRWAEDGKSGWYSAGPTNSFTKDPLGNGVYKLSFTEDHFDALILSDNQDVSSGDSMSLGSNNVGWYKPGNTGNWKLVNYSLYTLASSSDNSSTRTSYPVIFIDNACHFFTKEGDNWVYIIDASDSNKSFRIQNKENKVALGENVGNDTNLHAATNNFSASGSTTLNLYGNDTQYLTVTQGGTYKLSIPYTAELLDFNQNTALTITKTAAATPPYIYIDGKAIAFTSEGDNWVYTVNADNAQKTFRLQKTNSTESNIANMGKYTVIYGKYESSPTLKTSPATGYTEDLYLYETSSSAQNYVAPEGFSYKLSISKSAYSAVEENDNSNKFSWTVTPIPAGPVAPSAPTISISSDNMVTITAPQTGCEIWFTIDGTNPAESSTARKYDNSFKLTNGSGTIIAQVKNPSNPDGYQWSTTATKTYLYGMPVPTISISSSGLMTISIPEGEEVSDGVIKYVKGSVWNDAEAQVYSAPVQLTDADAGYYMAKYTSATFGDSKTATASWGVAKPLSVTFKDLNGNVLSTLKSTDNKTFTGFVGSLATAANNANARFHFEVSDGESTWYGIVSDGSGSNWIDAAIYNSTASGLKAVKAANAQQYFSVNGTANGAYNVAITLNDEGTDVTQISIAKAEKNPPFIYVNGKSQWFDLDGDNWVFTIDAIDGDVQFRLQNTDLNLPLRPDVTTAYASGTEADNKVLVAGEGMIDGACTRGLSKYNNGAHDHKVKGGAIYILSIPTSSGSDFNNATLTVSTLTDGPAIIREKSWYNYVTIKGLSGYELHYTVNGVESIVANGDAKVNIPVGGLNVTAWYTKAGDTSIVGGEATGKFNYYDENQPKWPTKKWSLSDNTYFPIGTYKYFYMSRFQNDDRVSPEWELIEEDNGKFALRDFMVIPAGEFRIRRIYKDQDGNLSYKDFGLDNSTRLQLANADQFDVISKIEEKEYTSKALNISSGKTRGYTWDMGYTMASVVVTHSEGDNLTIHAIANFTKPSTFNGAPLPGMPVVTLTSSNIRIPAVGPQEEEMYEDKNHKAVAAVLDESKKEYNTAFTNAWIQYDEDSNMLVYGDDVTGDIYKSDESHHGPQAGQVMNSTILPPRNPVIFKLVDADQNETRITSDKIILQYNRERSALTRQFKSGDGETKKEAKFAVYELRDMEMAGLFKIYSGYGGHIYGSVENGLSLFNNWGIGYQSTTYGGGKVASGIAVPLNGGGPRTDADGYAKREGSVNTTTEGQYGNEDNDAGQYFEFNERTYVSKFNFYYAIEPDVDSDNLSDEYALLKKGDANNYTSHYVDTESYKVNSVTNDGRNFSWFDMTYDGSIGRVLLTKKGANTGHVLYSINDFVANRGKDPLYEYDVYLIRVDKSGNPILDENDKPVYKKLVGSGDLQGEIILETKECDEADLEPGWYVAQFSYYSDFTDEEGSYHEHEEKVLTSTRIFVYGIEGAKLEAKQRTSTDADGLTLLYHPVIEVKPDASAAIAGLVNEEDENKVDLSKVYGSVTVTPISTAGLTKILDTDGKELPTSEDAAGEGLMYVDYGEGMATVHYLKGFFAEGRDLTMDFNVKNALIRDNTSFKLSIKSDEAATEATDVKSVEVYMPAAKLKGQIVADNNKTFNALRLADENDSSELSGVITYIDDTEKECGVAEVDDITISAQVIYGTYDPDDEDSYIDLTEVNKDGTTTKKLANMKALTGGVKRYAVGAIPYEANADGIRQDQKVPFTVNLTYSVDGFEDVTVNGPKNVLGYAATNLTAPRDGLKDIRSESDASNMGTGGIATDVTTLTDSYVENYGGLFTNIEDAHVALQAKEKNEELVGNDDFNLWTMDHGQYFPQTAEGAYPNADIQRPNPFSPLNHLAINQKNPAGDTAAAANEVHPLLREDGNKVVNEDSFKNNESVNNAWWNQRAQIAPAFHVDHISGTLKWDKNGVISFSNEGGKKPEQHRNFWAGVIPTNDGAYDAEWNGGKLELPADAEANPNDTDAKPTTYVHDPTHGYYDSNNHHTAGRSAYKMGEIPLNLNDILCLIGTGKKDANGQPTGEFSDYYNYQYGQYLLENGEDLKAAIDGLNKMHGYDQTISEKAGYEDACKSVMVDGVSRDLSFDQTKWWYLDKVWNARAEVAFNDKNSDLNMSPAEFIFKNFNNHMIFKVNHVNHESWFVPGAYYPILQHDYRTRPIWPAFESSSDFKSKNTDEERDNWVMNQLRMKLSDYCPLEYYARYSYPFLTSKDYVAGEDMGTEATAAQSRFNRVPAKQGAIEAALKAVNVDNDVTPVVAPSHGRVPFYGATTPDNVVPTAISNVSDDNISGNGFSIVYNRAAGTVTVTALGDRELKDAAVYDISGSSMIHGASADRVNDQTIVLDVRGIAQGAYIVSTNLGGAKFMK